MSGVRHQVARHGDQHAVGQSQRVEQGKVIGAGDGNQRAGRTGCRAIGGEVAALIYERTETRSPIADRKRISCQANGIEYAMIY